METGTAPSLLTIKETATKLNISLAKTYEMAHAGELPAVKLGRSIRIHAAKLQRYLDGLAGGDQ